MAHLVAESPIMWTLSPNAPPAAENVIAVAEPLVVKKKIPVAVVSNRIVVADESEKMNFSSPEDGAEIVKFLDVAVPEEKYDIP